MVSGVTTSLPIVRGHGLNIGKLNYFTLRFESNCVEPSPIVRPSRTNFHLGDRHDELSAPVADAGHLLHHFVPDVPGEDEDVVGLAVGDGFRREDRDVRAGEVAALFVRAAVDGEFEQVGPNAAEVQERVPPWPGRRNRRPTCPPALR